MIITALVTSEETRKGKKSGEDYTIITLQDMGEKPRCRTPMECFLDEEDKDMLGKLDGETFKFNVLALEVGYKDSISARVRLVRKVDAKPAASAPAPGAVK